jgi:hypothetical protein
VAIRRKTIDYTGYPPRYNPDKDVCYDFRTVVKSRLAAKRFGIGSLVRRNINLTNKPPFGEPPVFEDWWVEKVWEWDGISFRDITNDHLKGRS